jgi:hypothetical protein
MSASNIGIPEAWDAALALWDVRVDLSPPEALVRSQKSADWGGDEPLAYIDMVRRQVVVNFALLDEIGASASLTAVLAHEIGHHVAFPHTLGLAAQLQLLEQRLIPGLQQSLTNLFFDLQVNEVVGRTLAAELAAVYRGFVARDPDVSPLFWFYLAIYEELWGLAAGTLAPEELRKKIEKEHPGARAQARMFAQTFWALGDTFLQFVYFCAAFLRYLPQSPGDVKYRIPMGADVPQPDLDDWAGGLYGSDQADRALDEAKRRGWIGKKGAAVDPGTDPLATINRVFGAGSPGSQRAAFREALVARHYKRLVDQHLLEIPPDPTRAPDPFLPTTTTEWEAGDDLRAIDWTASILERGVLAPLAPLRRDLEPEAPSTVGRAQLFVEIYLDTSGSMPDPGAALNAMTLAALVLSASAIRHKGKVRAIVYSSDYVLSDWIADEENARRALLHYSGGGTSYPWKVLDALAKERDDVVRVVISDGDFLYNLREKGARAIFERAIPRSRRFVTLLHLGAAPKELEHPGLRVVCVPDLSQFGKMAADLARALFGRVR